MEKQQRQQANKQQQTPADGVKSAVTTTNSTGIGHLDPIQSIANVLNHHHLEQRQRTRQLRELEQKAPLRQFAKGREVVVFEEGQEKSGEKFVSVSSETTKLESKASNDKEESGHLNKRLTGGELVGQRGRIGAKLRPPPDKPQVERASGRSLLLAVDNSNKLSAATATAVKQQANSRQQVGGSGFDRGAEAAAQKLQSSPAQKLQLGSSSSNKSSADLVVSDNEDDSPRHSQSATAATNSTTGVSNYKSAQVDQGNSYLYACNEFITKTSPSNEVHFELERTNSTRQSKGRTSSEQQQRTLLGDVREDLKVARQAQTKQQVGQVEQQNETKQKQQNKSLSLSTNDQTTKVSNSGGDQEKRKKQRERIRLTRRSVAAEEFSSRDLAADFEQQTDDDDEEEDEEEATTLSYILSRHSNFEIENSPQRHLAAGLRCNLLHQPAALNGRLIYDPHHQDEQVVDQEIKSLENPNHLRQYLQIEENFNSYKAARRKTRAPTNRTDLVGYQLNQLTENTNSSSNEQLQEQSSIQVSSSTKALAPRSPINQQQAIELSSSSLSSSTSSLANLTNYNHNHSHLQQHQPTQQVSILHNNNNHLQHQQQQQSGLNGARPRGYFQFLARFAPFGSGASNEAGGGPKMYSNGQLSGGQPGAYYVTTNQSEAEQQQQSRSHHLNMHHQHNMHHLQQQHIAAVHAHQQLHTHHPHLPHHHHHHQQHSYPVTSVSNSSLGSSGAFASSAVRRTTGWLRDLCSKRCLFVSCLMLIVFIFVLVISLGAYLNFLINANKVNLQPLSGRLRVMLDAMDGGGEIDLRTAETLALTANASADSSQQSNQAAELRRQMMLLLMATQQQNSSTTAKTRMTSQQILQKQRDFETILRGALDRTQPMLKTYPNHLVKLEVYSFKPSSLTTQQATATSSVNGPQNNNNNDLWVYFRLFVNKRSIQQDNLLMKRKSPDEQFDKQFLPRLTQQTLLNGFEQLITTFGPTNSNLATDSSSPTRQRAALVTSGTVGSGKPAAEHHQLGINSRRFGAGGGPQLQVSADRGDAELSAQQQQNGWSSRRSARAAGPQRDNRQLQQQQEDGQQQQMTSAQQLKSFDEQISRLMHLVQAIDLQSIFVTPDFDMIQTMPTETSQIMSETLRASRPIVQTTTPSSAVTTTTRSNVGGAGTTQASIVRAGSGVMLASGAQQAQYETIQDNNNNKLPQQTSTSTTTAATNTNGAKLTPDEAAGRGSGKFTLSQSYRENPTRPSASQPTKRPIQQKENSSSSLFLVNHQQKPTATPATSTSTTANRAHNKPHQQPDEPVVRLVSGQPVVSQSGETLSEKLASVTLANDRLKQPQQGLFAPLPKAVNGNNLERNQTNNLASSSTTSISIPELWQNAFIKQKQNVSAATTNLELANNNVELAPAAQPSNRPRLITVTTIGNGNSTSSQQNEGGHLSPSEWQKISMSEVSNGINSPARGAQLNAPSSSSGGQLSLSGTVTPQTSTAGSSTARPPKVAPHLQLAGSLMSTGFSSNSNQKQQPAQRQQASSAVVLSREMAPPTTTATATATATASSSNNNSSNSTARANANGNNLNLHQPRRQAQKQPKQRLSSAQQTNSTSASSTRKPAKVKKVVAVQSDEQAASKNQTDSVAKQLVGSGSNSKGIRIVDNFLTSIGSSANRGNGGGEEQSANKTIVQGGRQATRTTEPSQTFAPTLPTTIELTRSSAPTPATRATTPTTPRASELDNSFVLASQQARPGTSSFSGQWRPLSSSTGSGSSDSEIDQPSTGRNDFWSTPNRGASSQRSRISGSSSPTSNNSPRPSQSGNMSLIVATERLPATLNQASGSQSPFSMPSLIMGPQQQPVAQFTNNRVRANQVRTTTPSNDFESHRVSRMRQSQSYVQRANDFADPFGGSGSSLTSSSSSTSLTTSTTTTTSSSLLDSTSTPPNTRLVDDFLITTTPQEQPLEEATGRTGGVTTMLPPVMVVSSRARTRPTSVVNTPIISLVLPQGLKRTRGPFAFETLHSAIAPQSFIETSSESVSSPSEPVVPSSLDEPTEPTSSAVRSERSSIDTATLKKRLRSLMRANNNNNKDVDELLLRIPVAPQEKLLLRKRLSVGGDQADELGDLASTSSPVSLVDNSNSDQDFEYHRPEGDNYGNRFNHNHSSQARSEGNRCPYFGCRSRQTNEFVCLNSSQICDDSVDCQDETDELDCVSLLKFEPKLNQMSFGNGAGIIYLNRRGSLAPMCLDYEYEETDLMKSGGGSSAELIRQINAIGQYACNLQSFSRLVSVKINHHDLVDGANLIRSSRRFHRLKVSSSQTGVGNQQLEAHSKWSRQTLAGQHQVSITSSSECPSQRTVFVKCGGFECGQDSFGPAMNSDKSLEPADQLDGHERDLESLKDFPWLVKLHHLNSLACHGYLIDESWLIASSECFNVVKNNSNEMSLDESRALGWTAEISHEHHANDYYKSIESNRRQVKRVLEPVQSAGIATSTIVLAELERPVRFSPLNRPICLPAQASKSKPATGQQFQNNSNADLSNCFTAALLAPNLNLAFDSSDDLGPPTRQLNQRQSPSAELVLNKVELLAKVEDCFQDKDRPPLGNGNGLICATQKGASNGANRDQDDKHQEAKVARVLICSQSIKTTTTASDFEQTPKLRTRWAFVGIQFKLGGNREELARSNRQLFVGASKQIDWIVDTMNPKSTNQNNHEEDEDQDQQLARANPKRSQAHFEVPSPANYTNTPFHLRLNQNLPTSQNSQNNGGHNSRNQLNTKLFNNQQTCNRFKCSSGECLSWSRICDGLYDCSSHDDERDCHK